MKLINFRNLFTFLGISLAIGFWIFLEGIEERRLEEFTKKSYQGLVNKVEFRPNRRGCADILIGNEWMALSMEEQKIFDKVKAGDSIVKEQGSQKITLYRRDSLNALLEMEF